MTSELTRNSPSATRARGLASFFLLAAGLIGGMAPAAAQEPPAPVVPAIADPDCASAPRLEAAALSACLQASPEPELPDPRFRLERNGLTFALSFGPGRTRFQRPEGLVLVAPQGDEFLIVPVPERNGLVAMNAWIGWGFADRFAFGLDGDVVAGNGFNHLVATLGVQYWPASRLWLRGGVGGGSLRYSVDDVVYQTPADGGVAFAIATGIDLVQRRDWTAEVQVRVGEARYDVLRARNLSVVFGFGRY